MRPLILRLSGDYAEPSFIIDEVPMLTANPMSDRIPVLFWATDEEEACVSDRSSAGSEESTSGSNEPGTTSPSSAKSTSGGEASSPPASPGSPATPTCEESASPTPTIYVKTHRAESPEAHEKWEESDTAPTLDAGGQAPRTATMVLAPALTASMKNSKAGHNGMDDSVLAVTEASTKNWRLTEEQKQEAVTRYRDGESCGMIAERFGVSRQSMWDVLHRRTEMRPKERLGKENHFWRGGTRAQDEAQNKLEKALQRGEIVRPETCERCGKAPPPFKDGRSAIQGHHADYAKPLEVTWLCQPCHHEWHQQNVAEGVTPSEAPQKSTSSAAASRDRAKTSASPGSEPDSCRRGDALTSSLNSCDLQMGLFQPEGMSSLRTYPDFFPARTDEISPSFSRRWPSSGFTTSPGECWTADTSEFPSGGGASTSLADVLVDDAAPKYFLSPRAAAGILRRARKRGRTLPSHLELALEHLASGEPTTPPTSAAPSSAGTPTSGATG